ncbi:TetR/AcrR family transcriptional regulator [Nonomuraea sp. NPDC050783]|uniref:TetR/AcrR family transcriptional regulator n=1 Tax=Nonomuraea sp. NPDC050783 TaxID=3154634 RepID=UPI003466801F
MTRSRLDASGAAAARLPRGLRRAWALDTSAPKRGPKASLSIARILDEAVSVADAEGLPGVTLTRLAEGFGVSTNALYRYFDSREELDLLLHDHALGTPQAPARERGSWQDSVRAWAHALRARYVAHPWLFDLRIRVPLTPHSLAWLEMLLTALEHSGLDDVQVLRAAALLDGYVRWNSAAARDVAEHRASAVDGTAVLGVIGPLLAERGMPRIAALFDQGLYRDAQGDDDADFDYGLSCIISGLSQGADQR